MDLKKINPLLDRVLLEPLETRDKTRSGIYIPDTAKEKPQEGRVIATGKGTEETKMMVKAGDIVVYGKYSGTDFEIAGKTYLFLNMSDIYAIIKS